MSDPDPRYEIDNPEIKALLHALGNDLRERLPPGWGFTLFIFEYSGEGCFYLSTADRKDMIKVLREHIRREEAQ